MIATAFFFYLFSLAAIASAVLVITMKNPVHSVLFLILCFRSEERRVGKEC